ncbi:MAG: hypothetical protein LUQ64_02150 [Methanomicrobiales archaeon]|nr:hypothetical protein [Methanomicrobiales archaeon]
MAGLLLVLLLAAPAAADLTIFFPSSASIASTGVMDMAEGENGEIYFATDAGLSVYRDGWTTLRTTTPLASGSLLSDHVLAVETDHRGFAWVGYPNGLQVLAGPEITTIQDQQFLKNLNINALYRSGEDMWVATGSAGVQRWHNGTWHRFAPWGEEGLGAYDVRSIAQDPESGSLYFSSADNGVWVAYPYPDRVSFTRLIAPVTEDPDWLRLRPDPLGGIYLFNRSTILHHSLPQGIRPVPSAQESLAAGNTLYDLTISRTGALWLGTGDGMYGMAEGHEAVHLDALDGIGPHAVKRIFADRQGRIWFVTGDRVGFLPGTMAEGTPVPVHVVETGGAVATPPVPTPYRTSAPPLPTPVISVEVSPLEDHTMPGSLPGFLSDLSRWLERLFGQNR